MTCYEISYKLQDDITDLSNAEKATLAPHKARVTATNLTRAISTVINNLKSDGTISGKSDVIILEGKVVV